VEKVERSQRLMEINREFWTTLFFTVLNILILYFILKKILFKPVTKFMNTRSDKIKEALKMAEETRIKVEKMEEEHQSRLKKAKKEGEELIKSYEAKAKKAQDEIIAKAKEDSAKLIENTRNELEVEKEQLLISLKTEISDLVLEASEKILNKNLDNKENRKLIENFINEDK